MRLLRDFSYSAVNAGLLTVLVGFSSSVIIVIDAATRLGASAAETGSWILALCAGIALTGIYFSLKLRAPVTIAWSTSGAALIATSAPELTMAEAVGAFVVCGVLLALTGGLRLLDKLLRWLPPSVAAAMLAGVLLRYGLGLFKVAERDAGLVLLMLIVFVALVRLAPRYAVVSALLAGAVYAYGVGELSLTHLQWTVARPVLVTPEISFAGVVGLAVPLFIVTMASQNVPGAAVLRGSGFAHIKVSPVITGTGLMTVLLASFGAFALCLATITAAVCAGPDAHPDPGRRYIAGVFAALFYALAGVFGMVLVQFFMGLPPALAAAFAGVALLSVLAKSFGDAMADPRVRWSSLLTFLCSASGANFGSVGAAFWALVIGLVVHRFLERRATARFAPSDTDGSRPASKPQPPE